MYLDIVEQVANLVYDNLNIPKDIYKTFDLESASAFKSQYLNDTSYLRPMIADELFNLNLDIAPKYQNDLIEDIVFEVSDMLEEILAQYTKYQHVSTLFEYQAILQALKQYALDSTNSIEDIQAELSSDYLEYGEDPTITIKLDNGATINMVVTFEEDYDNI